jgi:hypothetical protein
MIEIDAHLVNGKFEPVTPLPEAAVCFSVNKYYVFESNEEFQTFVNNLNINVDVS